MKTKLVAIIDRGFSYVQEDREILPGECCPEILARELMPEYAVLFAAAPDMLEALKYVIGWTAGEALDAEKSRAMIRAAIDKAEPKKISSGVIITSSSKP